MTDYLQGNRFLLMENGINQLANSDCSTSGTSGTAVYMGGGVGHAEGPTVSPSKLPLVLVASLRLAATGGPVLKQHRQVHNYSLSAVAAAVTSSPAVNTLERPALVAHRPEDSFGVVTTAWVLGRLSAPRPYFLRAVSPRSQFVTEAVYL